MFYETFSFDLASRDAHVLLVGDDVFSGAHVEWRKFIRGDREFFFELIEAALNAWHPTPLPPQTRWRFSRTPTTPYALSHLDDDTWRLASPWDDLSPEARDDILEALDQSLDLLHGLLKIY